MLLAETKHRHPAAYLANVVWCVLDNAVKRLNQVVPYDDLVSTADIMCLQFPTTKLHRVAEMLSMQSKYTMTTFPREWQAYAEREAIHRQFPATVSFGSSASTAGLLSSGVSTITCNSRGTGSTPSGGNKSRSTPEDKKQATQGAPP